MGGGTSEQPKATRGCGEGGVSLPYWKRYGGAVPVSIEINRFLTKMARFSACSNSDLTQVRTPTTVIVSFVFGEFKKVYTPYVGHSFSSSLWGYAPAKAADTKTTTVLWCDQEVVCYICLTKTESRNKSGRLTIINRTRDQ